MSQLCTQLFETGLDEHKQRETELNLFYSGQRQLLRDEQEKMSDILTNFAEKHKKVRCEGGCWPIVGGFFGKPGEIPQYICWFCHSFSCGHSRRWKSCRNYQTRSSCQARLATSIMTLMNSTKTSSHGKLSSSTVWRLVVPRSLISRAHMWTATVKRCLHSFWQRDSLSRRGMSD